MRTEAAIKRVREWIRRNALRKKEFLGLIAKHIAPIDVTSHQGRSTRDSLPEVERSYVITSSL